MFASQDVCRAIRPGTNASVRKVVTVDRYRWLAGMALLALFLLGATGVAEAGLTWSEPFALNYRETTFTSGLTEVACPAVTLCAAVDGSGSVMTFDPASPTRPARTRLGGLSLAPNTGPEAIACPSETQCTAVTSRGLAVTFDPRAPSGGSPAVAFSNATSTVVDIACPTMQQCTVLDWDGVVTFDPSSPGGHTRRVIAENDELLSALSCPSAHDCVAVGSEGAEVTFDPTSPGAAVRTVINPTGLSDVSCPSPALCVAVEQSTGEITFDPRSPNTRVRTNILTSGTFTAVECLKLTRCTAVTGDGKELSFDPSSPGSPEAAVISPGVSPLGLACPTATQCTAVGEIAPYFLGWAVTFDPTAPGVPVPAEIDPASQLSAMACPASTRCVAVDSGGNALAFDPAAPGLPTPAPSPARRVTSRRSPARRASVRGALAELWGTEGDGVRSTLAGRWYHHADRHHGAAQGHGVRARRPPVHRRRRRGRRVDVRSGLGGHARAHPIQATGFLAVACPSATQCTALDGTGAEVTFDPAHPSTVRTVVLDQSEHLRRLDCPSERQCTAISAGTELTFDPQSSIWGRDEEHGRCQGPGDGRVPVDPQCTAHSDGYTVTFDPRSPGMRTRSGIGAFTPRLAGIACPSPDRCTGFGGSSVVSFDPSGEPRMHMLDAAVGLNAVTCPTDGRCVGVGPAGMEVGFDPGRPPATASTIDSTVALTAVACGSETRCTAVDVNGGAVSFDPASPGRPARRVVGSPFYELRGSPAPRRAGAPPWTAAEARSRSIPARPGSPARAGIDGKPLNAIACPLPSQCTAVDDGGRALTFDPASPGTATPVTIDEGSGQPGSARLLSIACPSADQCTAGDGGGAVVTFDPMSPGGAVRTPVGNGRRCER